MKESDRKWMRVDENESNRKVSESGRKLKRIEEKGMKVNEIKRNERKCEKMKES